MEFLWTGRSGSGATAVESLCNMKQLLKFLPDLKRIAELISRELGYARQSFSANAFS
jgi:hypothetical protein